MSSSWLWLFNTTLELLQVKLMVVFATALDDTFKVLTIFRIDWPSCLKVMMDCHLSWLIWAVITIIGISFVYWRKPGTISMLKHVGGSIIMWGCSSAAGARRLVRSKAKMNGAKYREIPDENLLQSSQGLRLGWRFKFVIFRSNRCVFVRRRVGEWMISACVFR